MKRSITKLEADAISARNRAAWRSASGYPVVGDVRHVAGGIGGMELFDGSIWVAYDGNPASLTDPSAKKRSKYGNVKCEADGITFDSKREAAVYTQLKARRDSGEIKSFMRQVSIPIGKSKRRLRLDFIVIHHDDRCEFIDAKGMTTPSWAIKRDEFEANYLVKVQCV